MPVPWYDLAKRLAARSRQPILWYLYSLLAEQAQAAGEPHPPLPWDVGGDRG
jgi:hypothetical protein